MLKFSSKGSMRLKRWLKKYGSIWFEVKLFVAIFFCLKVRKTWLLYTSHASLPNNRPSFGLRFSLRKPELHFFVAGSNFCLFFWKFRFGFSFFFPYPMYCNNLASEMLCKYRRSINSHNHWFQHPQSKEVWSFHM